MELARILIRELTDFQLIELREVVESPDEAPDEPSSARSFPIVIGLPEAQAIERRLKGLSIKRPQTHDLLASVITHLGGTLVSITINDLSEETFYATLDIRAADGELIHVDSRPSDAIALGIAGDVPIFVAEHVLELASRDPSDQP
ncbi:MAG: bifunctional nuclease family protein [Phycisphaeraceae bacterium]|nr:bifunctional nuclease family protein [Phycisphaeraceae bacterium]